jgi:hypothetical protein
VFCPHGESYNWRLCVQSPPQVPLHQRTSPSQSLAAVPEDVLLVLRLQESSHRHMKHATWACKCPFELGLQAYLVYIMQIIYPITSLNIKPLGTLTLNLKDLHSGGFYLYDLFRDAKPLNCPCSVTKPSCVHPNHDKIKSRGVEHLAVHCGTIAGWLVTVNNTVNLLN